MPPGTMGNLVIKYLGFDPKGWRIAPSLYAMFSDAYPETDYFSNAKMLNLVSIKNENTHAPWTFLFGLRDLGSFLLAFGALAFNKLTAAAEPSVSSPVTYNEKLQDQIYDWGKQAISDWL